jgi:EamA domain-containing membrane protein RarD
MIILIIGKIVTRYTVGLDVDNFVFTVKILLFAENSYIISPLVLIALGIIYLFKDYQQETLVLALKPCFAGSYGKYLY